MIILINVLGFIILYLLWKKSELERESKLYKESCSDLHEKNRALKERLDQYINKEERLSNKNDLQQKRVKYKKIKKENDKSVPDLDDFLPEGLLDF
jgi:hypothetical protein